MKVVAQKNKLVYGRDVKVLTIGSNIDFSDYLLKNENKTTYGVVFCID